MTISRVGIIGYGAFGQLVHELLSRFAPSIDVRVFSSRREPDGKTFFSLEETASCDAVFFCVPISAFEETVQKALPHLRPDTVLVDIATVKVHTVNILKKLAAGRPYVATHPMWGPESVEKRGGNVTGLRIVIADHSIPANGYASLKAALESIGFIVIETTAEAHDMHLAATLFLTHYVGQIVSRAGFDRTDIDTVSFGYLMDAVESVKNDTALFADVFKYNPYCEDVLDRFEEKEEEVRALLDQK